MSDVKILATGGNFRKERRLPRRRRHPDRNPQQPAVKIRADGKTSVFSRCGGGPNGLAFGPDGALICNNGGSKYVEGYSMGIAPHPDYRFGYIQRIDAKTGETKTLYTEVGNKLSAPNDIVFDTHGGFYFTDLGKRYARHRDHGGLYYAMPMGRR